jgi:RecA-family ATPase
MSSLPDGEGAPGWMRPLQAASAADPFDWDTASDEAFWHGLENRRYRAGDRYVTGKLLQRGDPEVGRRMYPNAREHPREYWEQHFREAKELAAKVRTQSLPIEPMVPTLDLASLAGQRAEAKRFVIERIAPEGEVTLFTGPGSGGKSLLGQQLATASAAGVPCLGLSVHPGPAIYLTCEDDAKQLHWRQEHLCAALGVDMASLAGKLHLASLRGALDNELGTFTAEGTIERTAAYQRLAATIRETGSRLVFLDNVAHLFTGNENDRGQVTRFVNLLNRLAGETGAAIVLLGHPNKSGDSYSGSTAWLNAVRSQVTIDHERDGEGNILDPDARVLSVGKANYARKGEAVRFRWHEWAYVLEDDLPSDTRKELAEAIKANSENAAFLACLRERAAQGEGRAVGPSPGPNYAPAQFEGMAQAKGYRKPALKRAMDRLFTIGRIESHTYRNTAKGRDVTIIREVPEGTPNASPNASRTPFPNTPEQSARTAPHTHCISKDITGAAHWPAAPEDDDLDWGETEAAE